MTRHSSATAAARDAINTATAEIGLQVVGWREVPTDPSVCGEQALKTLLRIEQIYVNAPDGMPRGQFSDDQSESFCGRRHGTRIGPGRNGRIRGT